MPHYSQADMERAIAKYDPAIAHVMGAIAMAETEGYAFPTSNPTGRYHGPWAFQEAWAIPAGLSMSQLDNNLDYAAREAVKLQHSQGYKPWEVYTNSRYKKFLNNPSVTDPSAPANDPGTIPAGNTPAIDLTAPLKPLIAFFEFISDPRNWIRMGEFLAGAALLLGGLWYMVKDTAAGEAVARKVSQAKSAALTVATKGAVS